MQLQQHSELRAPTAERAAFYLDAAVAGRQREGDTHMLYTLHVYQYSVAGKGGGNNLPNKTRTNSRPSSLKKQKILKYYFFIIF